MHNRGIFAAILSLLVATFSVASEPKPRIVVLTDIALNDVEPDDAESMIRLLSHADLFEIEALVATTGWSNTGGQEHIELIHKAIDAYEKDLPNLMKRSDQVGFLADESSQNLGYWPSPAYLRSRTVMGSTKMGMSAIGENNNSAGSELIIKLADESDSRPIYIGVWGGANTLSQAIWQVQKQRTAEQLKEFLHKLRVYTITDQDRPWGPGEGTAYSISSHQWLRRDFSKDLFFVWDECAWLFQNDTGKKNWDKYAENIQGHGNLGALYPKFKWGVEGDTPSFLYVWPNGMNQPEHAGWGGWGGYFEFGPCADGITSAYTNHKNSPAFAISSKYQEKFYPAIFNSFAARMDWAKEGKGNRNPIVVVNSDNTLASLKLTPTAGSSVTLDASATNDPDGDQLTYFWWVMTPAGTYKQNINIKDANSNKAVIEIPADSSGQSFHVILEVTDNGTHNLSSYRRIIFEPIGS